MDWPSFSMWSTLGYGVKLWDNCFAQVGAEIKLSFYGFGLMIYGVEQYF